MVDLRVNTPIILAVVHDLRISSPHHLTTGRDQSQLANIHLDNRTLRQNTQLSVHWVLRVLLDADDR